MRYILYLLLSITQALAGGRGGYNTTFDPNSEGGGWTCFRSAASGTCGGATAQYFDATCDGVADDSSARAAFLVYGLAHPTPRPKLYFPPGSKCHLASTPYCFTTTCLTDDPVIPNALIWAYGASIDNFWFGGQTFYTDNLHNAYIQSANIGDSCVTLKTAADASIFSVGDSVLPAGLSLQKGGFPSNFGFYEHRLIASINGTTTKTLCFESPLVNQYLSTWPQIDDKLTGGPAAVYKLQPSWKGSLEVRGLTITTPFLVNIEGYSNILYDVTANDLGPSSGQYVWILGGLPGGFLEIDKNLEFVELFRTSAHQIQTQSASPVTMVLDSTTWHFINGMPKNTTINNTVADIIRVGPVLGHGYSVTLNGTKFGEAQQSNNFMDFSWLTYNNAGAFVIANNSAFINNAWGWGVPGVEYFFGGNDGSHIAMPPTTFHITGITSDGTNTSYAITCDTNCSGMPGTLPAPTCQTFQCSYIAYAAATITQRFSGPADLTQFAP